MDTKINEDAANVEALIRKAEEDIGSDDLEDYRIRPTIFPQTTQRPAPEPTPPDTFSC